MKTRVCLKHFSMIVVSQTILSVKVPMVAQGFPKMHPIKSKSEEKLSEHALVLYYNIGVLSLQIIADMLIAQSASNSAIWYTVM